MTDESKTVKTNRVQLDGSHRKRAGAKLANRFPIQWLNGLHGERLCGSIQPFAHFILLTHHWIISRNLQILGYFPV